MDYRTLDDFEVEEFARTVDDVCGRKHERTQMLVNLFDNGFDEMLYLSAFSMYLVTGPIGYGKSYLVSCCSQSLNEAGYRVYHLDFADFIDEDEPEVVWKSLGEEIVEKTDPEDMHKEKICLYVENLSLVGENRKLTRAIAKTLKKIEEKNCCCIVYATEMDASLVPVIILKHFSILELDLPKEEERVELFTKFLEFGATDSYSGDFNLEDDDDLEDDDLEDDDDLEEDENKLPFYPLDVKDTMDDLVDSDASELDKIALYCAKKTEGLSFGQLMAVLETLSKALKMNLIGITNCDIYAVASHVKHGQNGNEKTYVVKDKEFTDIVSSIKKAGEILHRAERAAINLGKENIPTVATQPQIVYSMMPPGGMPQGNVSSGFVNSYNSNNNTNYNSNNNTSYNSNNNSNNNDEKAKENLLNAALGDDVKLDVLFQAFSMLPKAENVQDYIQSEN